MNTGHLFFHEESYTKFQNISVHGFKLMLCTSKHKIKKPKIAKGHNSNNISLKWLKSYQVISSSVPINIPNIKVLAQILF